MGQETMRRSLYNSSIVEQRMYEYEEEKGRHKFLPRFAPCTQVATALPASALYDSRAHYTPDDSGGARKSADMGPGWRQHWEAQVESKAKVPTFAFEQVTTHARTRTRARTHTHTHTHTHAHTHTYTHTQAHAHTYTHSLTHFARSLSTGAGGLDGRAHGCCPSNRRV